MVTKTQVVPGRTLRPLAGTLGVAPAGAGHQSVPPRRIGGNLDMRDLCAGATLILPVEVEGALFSIADTPRRPRRRRDPRHGDRERHGRHAPLRPAQGRRFTLPTRATARSGDAPHRRRGYEVTTGIGPDLFAGARDAASAMIDLLAAAHGMNPVDAYMLTSVAGDLRISEIVDVPNWVVSLYMPRRIFE